MNIRPTPPILLSPPAPQAAVYAPCPVITTTGAAKREVLGSDRVVPIIYPGLDMAMRHNFGTETSNPREKLRRAVILEPDLSSEYAVLSDYKDAELAFEGAVEINATLLATAHARSLGVLGHLDEKHPDKLLRLLRIAHDDMRFGDAQSFGSWLKGPNWVANLFRNRSGTEERGELFEDVHRRMERRGIDLGLAYERACDASERSFARLGCVGHLDFKMWNIFVRKRDHRDVKLFDFDYATLVDPAYESGQTLYSILNMGITGGEIRDLKTAQRIACCYNEAYAKKLLSEDRPYLNGEFNEEAARQIVALSNFFAGFTLLSVAIGSSRRKYPPETQDLIAEMCLELLGSGDI